MDPPDPAPGDRLDASLDEVEEAIESTLVPPDVDELASERGLRGALRVPAELVDEELPGKSPIRRAVETIVSLSIVVALFALAIPEVTGTGYAEIWDAFDALDAWELAGLFSLWLVVMWTYTGVLTASLPGLGRTQALVMNFAGSAVSNVVPFGGAVGVGATYAMGRSWGFGVPTMTRSILVSGFWNVFAKLGIPVTALVLLAFSGQSSPSLTAAAAVGLVLAVAMVVVFVLVLRSDRLAAWVGDTAERVASWGLGLLRRSPVTGLTDRLVEFRHDSMGLIRSRWQALTFWMVVYTVGQFLLLLLCVRALGATTDELGWVEVFAAFAFNRLLTTIPLTPSGVGFSETGAVAALVAFGAPEDSAAAAVLLYSGFTYALEIPLGLVGWVAWATVGRWRKPVGEAEAAI